MNLASEVQEFFHLKRRRAEQVVKTAQCGEPFPLVHSLVHSTVGREVEWKFKFLVTLTFYRRWPHILNQRRQEFLAMGDERKMTGMFNEN